MANFFRFSQDLIRWAAIEKDTLEIRQRMKGYVIKSRSFDCLEIEVIPDIHFNEETRALWTGYISSPEVQSITRVMRNNENENEKLNLEFDTQYSLWDQRRKKLFQDLLRLEYTQKRERIKLRPALMHLAVRS